MATAPRIEQFLDTVGDGTGTTSAIGDYSVATDFKITAQDDTYLIRRMIVSIRDSGVLDAASYGNLPELTNGIIVTTKDENDVVTHTVSGQLPIKCNAHWDRVCYDVKPITFGSGDNLVGGRWTFEKAGQDIRLPPGHSLCVTLRDNMAGLVDHTFMAQGRLEW